MNSSARSKQKGGSLRTSRLNRRSLAVAEALEPRRLLSGVVSGQEVSGDIGTAIQQNTYTFTATAGGTIVASVGESSSALAPVMNLFSPSGILVQSASASSAGQIITLTGAAATSGQYSIVIEAGLGTGAYNFSEASLPGTQAKDTLDDAGGPVTSGQGVAGDIDGQLDAYSFSATAGGTINASAGETGSLLGVGMNLYSPTGALLQNVAATSDGQIVTLSQTAASTGTYYIVLDSANGLAGDYKFSEASFPGVPAEDTLDTAGGPVTSGQTVTGNIIGQLDAFSFTGTEGDTITATGGKAGSTLAAGMDLFSPTGALLKSVSATSAGQIVTLSQTAATTGTYYIVLDSANGVGGAYQFSVTNSAPTNIIVVTPPASQSAVAGIAQSFSLGSFTEDGATAPFSVSVNWGDHLADTVFSMAAAGTITAKSHTFATAGTDTVGITITDADGHVSNTATFTVTVAAAPLTLTTPANAAAVDEGDSYTIAWTGGSSTDTVQLWAEGGPNNSWTELTTGVPQTNGSYSWNTAGVDHGWYYFLAWDIPASGTPYSVVSPNWLHILEPGASAPVVSLSNPPLSTDSVAQGDSCTLNFTATDGSGDTNPIYVQLWVYSGDTGQWTVLPGANYLPAAQGSYVLDTTNMAPGWYSFAAHATNGDEWSYASSPGWLNVTVPTPTITFTTPTSGQLAPLGGMFDLDWNVTGLSGSDLSSATIQIWAEHLVSGSPVWSEIATNVSGSAGTFTWTIPTFPGPGTYYAFSIWLNYGNESWTQASPNWLQIT